MARLAVRRDYCKIYNIMGRYSDLSYWIVMYHSGAYGFGYMAQGRFWLSHDEKVSQNEIVDLIARRESEFETSAD
jgi:hypothetical protein